ncbi:MAG: hypothetical protein JO147_14920 [Actinobacteria bacterium]|nr:hypothetical protein [Actinomycetota bacterium]
MTRHPMPAAPMLALTTFVLTTLVACGGGRHGPTVAAISSSAGAVGGSHDASRVSALHSAAQCIRTHGVPSYQDPVLTSDGHVYTDSRSIEDFIAASGGDRSSEDAALTQLRNACGTLLVAAGFQPDDEAPAPPQLVQAGVKAAQCMRAHGLPDYRDPTSSTPFTPGHGFGITADELPNNGAAGKSDPTFQHAITSCRTELDAEIEASDLSSLAHD